MYAKENMTHNHDVFTKLHTLLETIQKEHEDKIKDCFLEPLKQAEDIKTQLSEVHRQINLILRETKTMERLEIDYMMEGVPVGVTIDVKYNKNHYKLKDSKIMEDSLRMLFDETLRCEPSITSCDYDIEYYKKYEESDEIVYEESFYDCGFNELSNESTPIKKDPLSGATPKSTTVVTNKSPTIELPFIPRYHIGRKFAGRKSCQARTSIKNVESQIVQIASADSLCAIKYKTDKGSKPEYCSIYNIESLEVSTISFQKDIIRYFLLK